jgi:hypothetical protein
METLEELVQECVQSVQRMAEEPPALGQCKTRYPTLLTVSDRIGTHGLEMTAWRWASPSSPTPSACR